MAEAMRPREFMARALALADRTAAGGYGNRFGAVIVKDGSIVGEGANRIHADHDPTAHGEVRAIQDACRRLGTRDLSGAVIYTSGGAPCPMCETACYWAGLDRIFHGDDNELVNLTGALYCNHLKLYSFCLPYIGLRSWRELKRVSIASQRSFSIWMPSSALISWMPVGLVTLISVR